MKVECPEWFDNWDPNLPLAQVSNICCQEEEKKHCCLCFVFGHNCFLPGDIGLGSLSSFAWLRQEGEDGSLLSNGGVFLFIVVMFISFYRCRSLN